MACGQSRNLKLVFIGVEMPQHPRYTTSPKKNIEKLFDLLSQLESFGFVHEDIHQNIDELMSQLHPNAFEKYTEIEREDNDSEFDGDDQPDESLDEVGPPSVNILFDYVDEEEREQFVQDLRNVIAHCMFSNSWNIEGVAAKILDMRDIEYYKIHTYLEEDTETKEKYEFFEKTVWFPKNINPLRVGIYEISNLDHQSPQLDGYAYWNGSKWYGAKILLKDCIEQKKNKDNEKWGSYCWRGFTEQVKPT